MLIVVETETITLLNLDWKESKQIRKETRQTAADIARMRQMCRWVEKSF